MAERPTYIDFLKALDYRLTEYGLTSTEQLLYHTLLLINNRKRWVDWFPCTDVYLTELMGVGRTAMHTARNGLKQAGMIDFKTSNKRGTSTSYHVCDEFCVAFCVYSINTQTNNKQTTNKPQTNNKPAPNKDIRHKTKDNNNPLTPFEGELGLKVGEWLEYKKEKGQAYKPTGLKQLITKIEKHVSQYGERAVIDALDTAMANSWQGFFVKPGGGTEYEVNRDRDGFDYGSIDDIMREKYDGG